MLGARRTSEQEASGSVANDGASKEKKKEDPRISPVRRNESSSTTTKRLMFPTKPCQPSSSCEKVFDQKRRVAKVCPEIVVVQVMIL